MNLDALAVAHTTTIVSDLYRSVSLITWCDMVHRARSNCQNFVACQDLQVTHRDRAGLA